jgi:hypothetical protein
MPYQWQSRWSDAAQKAMRIETTYLTSLLLTCPVLLFVLATHKLAAPLSLSAGESDALARYGAAWVGGTLGGCVFTIKWFYHSIARGKWHLDRRAWRFLTPMVSGALAFGTIALFLSQAVPIFDPRFTRNLAAIIGLSFLIGYFSDNTVAALSATADRVLGTKTMRPKRDESRPS